MIEFLNKNIHDPVERFIDDHPGVAIGAGSLGLLGLSYLAHRKNKVKERADKSAEDYIRRYGKVKPSEIKRLRELSKSDAKADYISPDRLESVMGVRNNAYWFPPAFAETLADDPRLPSDKKYDGKYGHIYYTDGTSSLPTLAHEYGHASEHKYFEPAVPSKYRWLLAGGGGLATSLALGALGLKRVPAALAGATAAAGLGYALNTPEVNMERRATERANKYLKSLKHSKDRLSAGVTEGERALDTYKAHRTASVIRPFLTSLAMTGIVGGGWALLNRRNKDRGII